MSRDSVYLAFSISNTGDIQESIKVANLLREMGYNVYVASENKEINDKNNDPTPKDIYDGDIPEIIKNDIFAVNLTGGVQDGTISEVGFVAGWNEALKYIYEHNVKKEDTLKLTKPIIAYTSNVRALKPQFYSGIPSAGLNHLVLGYPDVWGHFTGDENNFINKMRELRNKGENNE